MVRDFGNQPEVNHQILRRMNRTIHSPVFGCGIIWQAGTDMAKAVFEGDLQDTLEVYAVGSVFLDKFTFSVSDTDAVAAEIKRIHAEVKKA